MLVVATGFSGPEPSHASDIANWWALHKVPIVAHRRPAQGCLPVAVYTLTQALQPSRLTRPFPVSSESRWRPVRSWDVVIITQCHLLDGRFWLTMAG